MSCQSTLFTTETGTATETFTTTTFTTSLGAPSTTTITNTICVFSGPKRRDNLVTPKYQKRIQCGPSFTPSALITSQVNPGTVEVIPILATYTTMNVVTNIIPIQTIFHASCGPASRSGSSIISPSSRGPSDTPFESGSNFFGAPHHSNKPVVISMSVIGAVLFVGIGAWFLMRRFNAKASPARGGACGDQDTPEKSATSLRATPDVQHTNPLPHHHHYQPYFTQENVYGGDGVSHQGSDGLSQGYGVGGASEAVHSDVTGRNGQPLPSVTPPMPAPHGASGLGHVLPAIAAPLGPLVVNTAYHRDRRNSLTSDGGRVDIITVGNTRPAVFELDHASGAGAGPGSRTVPHYHTSAAFSPDKARPPWDMLSSSSPPQLQLGHDLRIRSPPLSISDNSSMAAMLGHGSTIASDAADAGSSSERSSAPRDVKYMDAHNQRPTPTPPTPRPTPAPAYTP